MADQIEAESAERGEIKTTKLKIFYTFRFLLKNMERVQLKEGLPEKPTTIFYILNNCLNRFLVFFCTLSMPAPLIT